MSTLLVSVLMPVYNSEDYLDTAIMSVLNQTFNNFEFLIINDCSTDNSLNLISSYTDDRIRVFSMKENSGISETLNFGLSKARGRYVVRMDSDDICLPNRIKKQVEFLENNKNYALCGSNYKILNTEYKVNLPENHDLIKVYLLKNCCIAHPTVVFRKSILEQNKLLYSKENEPAEDYNLWVKLILKGKFYNIQEELLEYRVHEKQISQKNKIAQDRKSFEVKIDYLKSFYKSLTKNEVTLLEKHFIKKKKIEELDIKKLKNFLIKIKKANKKERFCDENNFKKIYTSELENTFLTSLFSKNDRYTLMDFIYYLKIERKYKLKLNLKMKTRLLLKSIFFYKIKSSSI